MKKFLLCTAFLIPLSALAQPNLTGIPENCEAPMAHDMEMVNIPHLLDISDGDAHIVEITTYGGSGAYEFEPKRYKIDCYIAVKWSNGTIDWGYKFSAWEDRYGRVLVAYSRQRL